ncbi:MAG TPA: hypothetical protein PLY45_00390 [bacterium]|nr:hypothetical protein [bacterium]
MAGGAGTGYFLVRRLHTLSGLLVSLAYVFLFLMPMSAAAGGAASFNGLAKSLNDLPFAGAAMLPFVLAPLAFHAAVGLSMLYGSELSAISYGFYRNWMYALQRLTGVVLVPFVVFHVTKAHLAFAFTGRAADYAFMQKLLAPGWVRAVYVAGVISAAFHIGNGMATALARLGILGTRRAQDAAAMVMWVVTLVLAAWGVRVVYAF